VCVYFAYEAMPGSAPEEAIKLPRMTMEYLNDFFFFHNDDLSGPGPFGDGSDFIEISPRDYRGSVSLQGFRDLRKCLRDKIQISKLTPGKIEKFHE